MYNDYNTFIHALLHELTVELDADKITKESFKHNTMFLLSDAEVKELEAYKEILLNESSKRYYVFSKKHKEDDWTSVFINFGTHDEVPDEVSQYYLNYNLNDYQFISGTSLSDEVIRSVLSGKIK